MITRKWFVLVEARHAEAKGSIRNHYVVTLKSWRADPNRAIELAIKGFELDWDDDFPRSDFTNAIAIAVSRV